MPAESARVAQAERMIREGDLAGARALLLRALRAEPDNASIHKTLCFALYEMGELTAAEAHGRTSAEALPADPHAWLNYGMTLLGLEKKDEAIAALRRGVDADPSNEPVRYALCIALELARRYHDLLAEAKRGLDRSPASAQFASRYANALAQTGRATQAVAVLREALRRNPDDAHVATHLCAALTYAGDATPRDAFEAHEAYGRLLERVTAGLPQVKAGPARTDTSNPNRRLRVGFVSPDLHFHPVVVFLEPLLQRLRADAIESVVYSTGGKDHPVMQRIRSRVGVFRRTPGITTTELADLIRKDKVDILVDLSGHTSGHALPTFAMRPAPVQVTWLGFPNTTGVRAIDWRVTDSIADPPGVADPFATERLFRLDPIFLCYGPPGESLPGAGEPPGVGPLPVDGDPEGRITFGSFNSISKLDDATATMWSRVLGAVPGSRLLLKHTALAQDDGRSMVRERLAPFFEQASVAMDRLHLEGPEAFHAFLDAYNRVDIGLDTFPFGGATTTCDALFMGVPVVTRSGETTASRVCSSILTCVGLAELIARSEDEYVALARALAAPESRARLRERRAALRAQLLASPLCDAPAFARRFEGMLREMWKAHCAAPRG